MAIVMNRIPRINLRILCLLNAFESKLHRPLQRNFIYECIEGVGSTTIEWVNTIDLSWSYDSQAVHIYYAIGLQLLVLRSRRVPRNSCNKQEKPVIGIRDDSRREEVTQSVYYRSYFISLRTGIQKPKHWSLSPERALFKKSIRNCSVSGIYKNCAFWKRTTKILTFICDLHIPEPVSKSL